jgi:transposase
LVYKAELSLRADSESNPKEAPRLYVLHRIGYSQKKICFCVKDEAGKVLQSGSIAATRQDLDRWMAGLPEPWCAAMEATMFTGWIYDHLLGHAAALKVAHPLMLRAISASKKKNDRVDAEKICDALRCNLLQESYMPPQPFRELRRSLRYRNLLVRQMVQLKNKTAGLLMEAGIGYNVDKLHQVKYFEHLLAEADLPSPLRSLLKTNREQLLRLSATDRSLIRALQRAPLIADRVKRLTSIPAIGSITALTWVLETAEVKRFSSLKKAISYCGLCADENSSAGVNKRMPLTRQCNHALRNVLIEAAKLAPRYNADLAALYAKQREQGQNSNTATLAVARKLVAYLLAVDRREQPFQVAGKEEAAAA